jgi:cytochrome d ubiquinol oxidase subunit I
VSAAQVLTTLVLFVVVYGVVFAMGIYYMNRLINNGPQDHAPSADEETLPNRPIAAAHGAGREALGK